MKRILLLLFICGLTTPAFTQFLKKGSLIGGGSFEFQTTKYKDLDAKSHSFSIMPWAGYLVIDNLVVGASLEISNSGSTALGNKSSSNGFSIGPMVRYYLNQGIFFGSQYTFGATKVKSDFNDISDTYNSSIFRIGAGYAARITDTVLFEPMIGYYYSNNEVNDTTSGLFIMGGFTIILKRVQ